MLRVRDVEGAGEQTDSTFESSRSMFRVQGLGLRVLGFRV